MTTPYLYDPPYALWTIWHQLSLLNRGIVLILGAVFVHCVFSTVRAMLRLHTVWNRPTQERETVHDAITVLAIPYSRLRQVIGATFYLFALVLFVGLESTPNVLGDGKEPIGIYVLDNFLLLCAFAANVFLIFFVLHSIQWAGGAVLDLLSRRVSSQS
jgi:hypothetical protein